MIAYGKNVLDHLREYPDQIEEAYIQEGLKDKDLLNILKKSRIPVHTVSKRYLDNLTQKGVHQGVAVNIRNIKTYSLEQLIRKAKKPGLFLILDHLQDPQNFGAILRTADATGVDGIIIPKHDSVGFSPAAIKASTGAAFSVPVCVTGSLSTAIEELKKAGYWIVGTDFENTRDYREGIFTEPIALVIGNEGKGMSKRVKSLCDYNVNLPMKGKVSSLNASVATGILLYEINAQREKSDSVDRN